LPTTSQPKVSPDIRAVDDAHYFTAHGVTYVLGAFIVSMTSQPTGQVGRLYWYNFVSHPPNLSPSFAPTSAPSFFSCPPQVQFRNRLALDEARGVFAY
jgi:hypothetical protein